MAVFGILVIVLLIAIVIAIAGIILLRRHRANKTQPLLKYGIDLPVKVQPILGIALLVLSGLFIFWAVWSAVEWIMVRM